MMTNSVIPSCESFRRFCDRIYDNIPQNTPVALLVVPAVHFTIDAILTFNPQTAFVAASFTALTLLTQAVVLSILKSMGIHQLPCYASFLAKAIIPFSVVGLAASSVGMLTKEEAIDTVIYSLTMKALTDICFARDNLRMGYCRTDSVSPGIFFFNLVRY